MKPEQIKEQILKTFKEIGDIKQWRKDQQIKDDLERREKHKNNLEEQRLKEISIRNERRDLIPKRFKELEDFYLNFKLPCHKCKQLNKVYFGYYRGNISHSPSVLGISFCSRCKTNVKHSGHDGKYNTTVTTFCLPINCDISEMSGTVFTKYFSTMIDKQKRNKLFKKIPPTKLWLE